LDFDLNLMKKLRRTAALSRRKQSEDAASPAQRGFGHVLDLLDEKKGVYQKELADLLGIRPQSLSEAIAVLEKRGEIRREPGESDRRSYRLFLTEQGREKREMLEERRSRRAQIFFSPLTEEEKKTLFGLLDKIGENVQQKEDDA